MLLMYWVRPLLCEHMYLAKQHLVNNAGFVLGVERVGTIKPEDVESMFSTNVFGLISMTQLLIKGLPPYLSLPVL